MDEGTYRAWWSLHLRVAKGETLGTEEQAIYSEGLSALRAEEALKDNLAPLRQTRQAIRELEAERERLQEHRRQLQERVAVLESALSEKAKQALGVGD